MEIHPISKIKFKGYDARTLKGFLMSSNCHNIASEMYAIGQKEGFKIYTIKNGQLREGLPKYSESTSGLWAQDLWSIVKNKLLALEYDKKFYAIKNTFGLKFDFTEKVCHDTDKIRELNQNLWDIFDEMGFNNAGRGRSKSEITQDFETKKLELFNQQKEAHIPGGNVFIIKSNKVDEIIVGANELEKFTPEEILSMYSCDKMTILPQMDYHLDLFIRPLDKKRILIADDNKTLEILKDGFQKLHNFILSLPPQERQKYRNVYVTFGSKIANFQKIIKANVLPNVETICSDLRKSGFKPISVPARIYDILTVNEEQTLQHFCNYINANVFKNSQNEIVYITNKSNIDSMLGLTEEIAEKIGFSFEKSFINSISKYVKPNKVYFIKGDNDFVANEMLTTYQGGIHCACTEIPRGLKIKNDKNSRNK